PIAAPLAQVLIRSIDEVSAQPFVAVSRARGASTWWLLWRTVARNALLPTLTMAGLLFGELVGGAVVTETVFARMGIGQLTAQAVAARDTPVLMAVVVLSTVVFVLINLIVDLLYPALAARPPRTGSTAPTRRATVPPRSAPSPWLRLPSPSPRPRPRLLRPSRRPRPGPSPCARRPGPGAGSPQAPPWSCRPWCCCSPSPGRWPPSSSPPSAPPPRPAPPRRPPAATTGSAPTRPGAMCSPASSTAPPSRSPRRSSP